MGHFGTGDAGVVHGLGQLRAQLWPAARGGNDLLVWDGPAAAVGCSREVDGLSHLAGWPGLLVRQAGEGGLTGFGDQVTGPGAGSRAVEVGLLTLQMGVRKGCLHVTSQQERPLGGASPSVSRFCRLC